MTITLLSWLAVVVLIGEYHRVGAGCPLTPAEPRTSTGMSTMSVDAKDRREASRNKESGQFGEQHRGEGELWLAEDTPERDSRTPAWAGSARCRSHNWSATPPRSTSTTKP